MDTHSSYFRHLTLQMFVILANAPPSHTLPWCVSVTAECHGEVARRFELAMCRGGASALRDPPTSKVWAGSGGGVTGSRIPSLWDPCRGVPDIPIVSS